MNGFENRLFALMMRWDITRRWWENSSKGEETWMSVKKRLISILTTSIFIGFVVLYQSDLTPALVIIMERMTTNIKYAIRDWSYYRREVL